MKKKAKEKEQKNRQQADRFLKIIKFFKKF
jgi:hypothetical protein